MPGKFLRRAWRVVAVASLSAVVVAGCGSDDGAASDGGSNGTTAGEPQSGGEITVRQIQDVTGLDPLTGNSGYDQQTLYPIYDRLVNAHPETLQPEPGLATAWEYEDPTTLVLTLQDGVTFHDGTPFDGEAVKFNLERAQSLEESTVKQDVSMIDSVEVRGATEVQINLARPDSSILLILSDRAGMMVSPTAAQEGDLNAEPVGTGPFRFVEWLPGDRLVLEKNQDYWQEGLPHLDGITFRFITAPDTALNALQAGEVDVALQLQPKDVEPLEGNGDLQVEVHPSLFLDHCYLNFSKPPFDSKEARQAINFAIDRQAINEALAFGLGQPASQVFPTGYFAYQDDLADAFTHDPDRARSLLEEAGLGDGVSITGVTTTASDFARLNELIQSQLAEVGIEMTFEQMEPAASTSTFFEDLEPNVYCAAWSGRPDPSQTAQSLFGADSFFNAGGYEAPGMAEALSEAAGGQSPEDRAAAFAEVIQISQDDALHVPVIHVPNVDAYAKTVGGFTPTLGKADVSFLWRTS